MSFSFIVLLFHITAGVASLVAGAGAMIFRKGSARHGLWGDVFVIDMLGLGASGAYLGLVRHQPINVAMGSLTCYLVGTAWITARRREEKTNLLDWAALLVPVAVGIAFLAGGIAAVNSGTGKKDGAPAAMYFIFGALALLPAVGDIRMLVSGGVSGTQRLVRHLSRMCFALFIASGSLFLARPHLFPAVLRRYGVIVLLGILPLLAMIFWRFRVRLAKAYNKRRTIPRSADAYSLQA